jgi:hypothetical protein
MAARGPELCVNVSSIFSDRSIAENLRSYGVRNAVPYRNVQAERSVRTMRPSG